MVGLVIMMLMVMVMEVHVCVLLAGSNKKEGAIQEDWKKTKT